MLAVLLTACTSIVALREDGLFEDELAAPQDLPRYEIRDDGFYVDEKKTFLKGVCYHQDREGKGWATSEEDEESDIRLIKEMGANAIRTSHYPRGERFYDLCDKYGIYVWTELPLVDATIYAIASIASTARRARIAMSSGTVTRCCISRRLSARFSSVVFFMFGHTSLSFTG